jgi:pimeloyl-ACP methyl ester carboxylesterase
MFRIFLAPVFGLGFSLPAAAGVQPFPSNFKAQDIQTDGATIHVRVGGHGPAVVMLHGFADTGDMWAPLAIVFARDHTVIVPDLRGMGLSSHPETGYDKKTQGSDIARVLDDLKVEKADLVTHDIGNIRCAISRSSYDRQLGPLANGGATRRHDRSGARLP